MLKRVLGKANSRQNTALRSKGTAWAFALKVVEANSGLLRKQKGGEAFRFLLRRCLATHRTGCERYRLRSYFKANLLRGESR
ncbi:hypothetical protein EZU46_04305 [Campylobacter upsaliensis]|nr:hypothetical protein [Campylobacter upsaliensis]